MGPVKLVLSRVEITNLLELVLGSCSELVLMWAEHVNLTYAVLM